MGKSWCRGKKNWLGILIIAPEFDMSVVDGKTTPQYFLEAHNDNDVQIYAERFF